MVDTIPAGDSVPSDDSISSSAEVVALQERLDRLEAQRHDIRNIVLAIQHKIAELFAKRIDNVNNGRHIVLTPDDGEALRMIKRGIQLIAALMASDPSNTTLYKKPTDLITLVTDVAYFHEHDGSSSTNVCVVPESATVMADIDATKIWTVLHNLVKNAHEALRGRSNGKIEIYVSETSLKRAYVVNGTTLLPGNYVQIYIIDNGPGIPSELLGRIFNPRVSTKSSIGRGWGLSNVKSIVELHGGAINVRSDYEGEDSGTDFQIILPKHEVEQNEGLEIAENLSGVTVLVVDDDEDQCFILEDTCRKLNPHGFHTFECECDLNQWLLKNEENLPSDLLIILDNDLPGKKGPQFAPDLRRRFPNATIILVTSDLDDRKMATFQPLIDSLVFDSVLEKRAGAGANDPQNWLKVIAERRKKLA